MCGRVPIGHAPSLLLRGEWHGTAAAATTNYILLFFHFLIKGKKMTEPWDSSAVIDCAHNNESSSIDTLLLFHPIHQRESLGHRRKPPDPQVRADVYTVQHRPIYTSTPDGESHVSAVNHCEHTHSQRLWTRCWEKI